MTTVGKAPVEIYTLVEGSRYAALSQSQPGLAYEIVVHSPQPGDISCGCKGFEYRQRCKHTDVVMAHLERTREQARQQLELKLAELYG